MGMGTVKRERGKGKTFGIMLTVGRHDKRMPESFDLVALASKEKAKLVKLEKNYDRRSTDVDSRGRVVRTHIDDRRPSGNGQRRLR